MSEAFRLTVGISPFGVDLTISSTLSVASMSFLFLDELESVAYLVLLLNKGTFSEPASVSG